MAAKARQRSLFIHRRDRSVKPQVFRLCGKAAVSERGFKRAVSLQQRCGARCAHARCARQLVRWIAAQGDKIRNLRRIDAIARADFGRIDPRHLAGADGIEDGGAIGGKLEGITVAARNENGAAALFFRCGSGGEKIVSLVEAKLIVLGRQESASEPDANLVKALTRAHAWFGRIVRGEANGPGDIAKRRAVIAQYLHEKSILAGEA